MTHPLRHLAIGVIEPKLRAVRYHDGMPVRAFLIRLLLSFVMILNGSVAAAGVMPGMAGAGKAIQAESAMAGAGDCHDVDMQPPVAESSTGPAHHASADQHAGDSGDHTTPDCCKSGACNCACGHATARVDFLPVAFKVIAISATTAVVDRSVIAIRPSRLDRPPIG